jgi:hypothetical protein
LDKLSNQLLPHPNQRQQKEWKSNHPFPAIEMKQGNGDRAHTNEQEKKDRNDQT